MDQKSSIITGGTSEVSEEIAIILAKSGVKTTLFVRDLWNYNQNLVS